ncbi:translation initiation factor IF-2-like isoform X2 [Panthera uncia]|uniref:translation initiation factor IF-2-like isoform X2 n=1 Tax=Panthera uncia TaxID=29064 RepID=UPI0020FFC3C7|nr:translation initiation factor IF-2-like isoform X2 [Panthera uncia]
MVPTQPLLALGFLPPPLGAAAASHPHFRLLLPEIPELAHPPGCGVTAAPCRDRPRAGGPRRERGAGGAFPSPAKGGGAAPGAGYHGNRKARDRPPSAPQQVHRAARRPPSPRTRRRPGFHPPHTGSQLGCRDRPGLAGPQPQKSPALQPPLRSGWAQLFLEKSGQREDGDRSETLASG